VLFAILCISPTISRAQDDEPSPGDNAYCVLCHSESAEVLELSDGSTLDLSVNPEEVAQSVHSRFSCTDCHGENAFPHDEPPPQDRRRFTVDMSAEICATCHQNQTHALADSVHQQAIDTGNLSAATCTDCHSAHNVQPPGDPVHTAQACGNCHQFVFDEFENSIHGTALFAGDTNVPSCANCHGSHQILHPPTAQLRNSSPELCATCHADKNLMDQYGITTNVFDSYLSDFHGTTVALFELQDPNIATNKAVCFDCHGVHDIAQVSDENSHVVRENLLETCQHCHPDATSNFPDAWVGHYPPTLQSHPLLFTVKTFYRFLIPAVIGAFLLLIATDIIRRVRERVRRS
jgi:predicted CXXCH cytochrome family protein